MYVCLPKNSINSIDIHKTKYMLLKAGNKVNEYTTPTVINNDVIILNYQK